MKLLVSSHLYPRLSNPIFGIFIHEQVKALQNLGIEITVLSGEPFWINTFNPFTIRNALAEYRRSGLQLVEYDNVTVCYFPYVTGWICPFEFHAATYARGAKRAAVCLGLEGFDVIHAHTSFLDGTAAKSLSSLLDIEYLITEHTGPFSQLTQNRIRRKVTTTALSEAERVFAVSPSLAAEMREHTQLGSAVSIQTLPNGVDETLFSLRASNAKLKNCPGNNLRGLWVGHHVPVKRVDMLIQAFAQAYEIDKSLHLTIVGDGALRVGAEESARRLGVSDSIKFLGACDRIGVADLMSTHDFLVISSEVETFGVVAIEALSSGIPVVSTKCGGPESIIEHGTNGLLTNCDVGSLRDGLVEMSELIRDGKFEAEFLRNQAVENFSQNSIAGQLLQTYAEIDANLVLAK